MFSVSKGILFRAVTLFGQYIGGQVLRSSPKMTYLIRTSGLPSLASDPDNTAPSVAFNPADARSPFRLMLSKPCGRFEVEVRGLKERSWLIDELVECVLRIAVNDEELVTSRLTSLVFIVTVIS